MINDLRFASMHKLLPQNKRGLKLAKRNYEILQLNYGLVERPFSQCHIVVKFSYTVNVIEWSLWTSSNDLCERNRTAILPKP